MFVSAVSLCLPPEELDTHLSEVVQCLSSVSRMEKLCVCDSVFECTCVSTSLSLLKGLAEAREVSMTTTFLFVLVCGVGGIDR